MSWQRYAACLDHDPELFFPIGDAGPALTQLEAAKAVCAGCPVRELCLSLGPQRDEYGVWGGVLLESGKPQAAVPRRGRPPKIGSAA